MVIYDGECLRITVVSLYFVSAVTHFLDSGIYVWWDKIPFCLPHLVSYCCLLYSDTSLRWINKAGGQGKKSDKISHQNRQIYTFVWRNDWISETANDGLVDRKWHRRSTLIWPSSQLGTNNFKSWKVNFVERIYFLPDNVHSGNTVSDIGIHMCIICVHVIANIAYNLLRLAPQCEI